MKDGTIVVSLFYNPCENSITHEDGRVIDNLLHLISYDELEQLKRVGGTKYIQSDEDMVLYELVAPIPDDLDIRTFYYNKDRNVMEDSEGYVMFNIFAHIRPHDLMLFKEKKCNMRVYGRNGKLVDLIYSMED